MTGPADPYRTLGLQPGASQAEIKRAYRRQAKALHPDAAGEAALPAFLALQDAYERLTGTKVRTVRAPAARERGSAGAGASAGQADGFREPWRADPARARAAREQAARARRGWPAGEAAADATRSRAAGPGAEGSGRGARAGGAARDPRRTRPPSSARQGHDTADAEQGRGGSRRRASRKATLGSTSYDEAREQADRSWAGASWYGPTTGEYWHINPREYADPRKHGPGYTSRGRGGTTATPGSIDESPSEGPPSAAAPPSGPQPGRREEPPVATASPPRAVPSEAGRTRPDEPILEALARTTAAPPIRRLGLVLLAWPPLGIAAAAAIGQATGCSSYSVSCDSTDLLLPWFAQGLLILLLLASPWLARVLGAGTVAALVGLVPGVGLITAMGGATSPQGPPVLAGWLAAAWLVGVFVGARRALRGLPDGGGGSGS